MKIGKVSLATTGNKLELEHPNNGGGEHIIKQNILKYLHFKYLQKITLNINDTEIPFLNIIFSQCKKKNVKINIQVLLSLWDIWSSTHTHTHIHTHIVFKQVSATQTI